MLNFLFNRFSRLLQIRNVALQTGALKTYFQNAQPRISFWFDLTISKWLTSKGTLLLMLALCDRQTQTFAHKQENK